MIEISESVSVVYEAFWRESARYSLDTQRMRGSRVIQDIYVEKKVRCGKEKEQNLSV